MNTEEEEEIYIQGLEINLLYGAHFDYRYAARCFKGYKEGITFRKHSSILCYTNWGGLERKYTKQVSLKEALMYILERKDVKDFLQDLPDMQKNYLNKQYTTYLVDTKGQHVICLDCKNKEILDKVQKTVEKILIENGTKVNLLSLY
jgi:hypothetical protein